jgi:hypothetical protein
VLRKLLIAVALAAMFVTPGYAQGASQVLMPGVTYERQVQFTSNGPVAIHVVTAPRPGGLWSLRPVLSNGAIVGRELLTSMQRAIGPSATVAGVNGDLFSWEEGRPTGVLMRGGTLEHPPMPERSSIGIATDGSLRVDRVRMFGTWRGTGQRRTVDLNQAPAANGISLFTPAWGPTTPAATDTLEAVVQPFPPAVPNVDHVGPVIGTKIGGGTPIPLDGAVLVARGTAAQRLTEEAPVGTPVTIRFVLNPDWTGIAEALGGGPVLVRDGAAVFRHFEAFSPEQLARNPRTAVGQLADGRILLVVVDGRRPGYSVGMTNWELAQTLVRLGAVTASGLDAGGSSTMAFDGGLLNRPSDPGGEREVSEGLFVLYSGAYAAPPREAVLSPNGDGVAEVQTFRYKLVRQSHVVVTLVAPNRATLELEVADKPPGVYDLTWDGTTAAGIPQPEGLWRLNVAATDDLAQTSTAERPFSLNRTLAGLVVSAKLIRVHTKTKGPQLRASFTLTRAARVTAAIYTPTGALYAVATRASRPAGVQTVAWNGRAGRSLARTGRYLFRVTAVNEVGRTELSAPFVVRRVAPPKTATARR